MASPVPNEKTLQGVWRATVLAKRKEGLSQKEFSLRFSRHAELAGPLMVKHNALYYIQHHILDSHKEELTTLLGPELAPYMNFVDADGIVTAVFPTAKDMAEFFRDPLHASKLNADVAEYADIMTVKLGVGDEFVVVQDGKLVI